MGKLAEQPRNKGKSAGVELQAIQSDVASFAASLGLSAGGGVSGGFDDTDFRKKGSINKKPEKDKLGSVDSDKAGKEKKKKVGDSDAKGVSAGEAGGVVKKKPWNKENSVGNGKFKHSNDRNKGWNFSAPLDAKPGGWKSQQHDANARKRKASWENEGDEEGEAKRPLVERPFGESESVQKLRSEAQELLEKLSSDFEKNRSRNKDAEWLLKARRSGTSADKVAAMTVLLQENPKANVRALDSLLGMVTSKAGKRHAATGIDALRELFLYNLLPNRKLKHFSQQPLSTLPEGKDRASMLLDWIWEDCLKHRYERFVVALDEASRDSLPFMKEKALKSVYELLKSKPEQERRLLSTIVNKLGDPERKVASNASYLLSCLLTTHPNMKKVVVDEVDAFVFRPHVGLRARYYAAIFLNQIILSVKGDGPKLAKQLIDLYFALFKAVTTAEDDVKDGDRNGNAKKEKKGKRKDKWRQLDKGKSLATDFTTEVDSRLLIALLTGVNRAFPYISAEDLDTVTQENSVLFRLVHSSNFNVAVQALMLLHQLMVKNQAVSDRFYRALYSVLLSDALAKSTKAEMFLGLIFKALKSDVDPRRMSAFAKRLTQVAMQQSPEFACASLFLISETLKLKPNLWNSILNPEDHDDDIEHFEDQRDDSDDKDEIPKSQAVERAEKDIVPNSGVTDDSYPDTWPQKDYYNPKARDPLYSQAYRACWWELCVLARHVHPSVAAMARTLLSGANIVYNGDPLRDLALGVFLDRFVEKKPKGIKAKPEGTWHGGSSMALPTKMLQAEAKVAMPVGEDILKLAEEDVPPEDVIFHKFYSTKATRSKPIKKKKKKTRTEEDTLGAAFDEDDSDDEGIDDLLEQDETMVEADDNVAEESDTDDEGMVFLEKDDGLVPNLDSEVEEADSEEEDDALEAGLAISSSEEGEEDESEEEDMGTDREELTPIISKKQKTSRKSVKRSVSVFQQADDSDGKLIDTEEAVSTKRKQKSARKSGKKLSSDFQEPEDFDFDDYIAAVSTSQKARSKKQGQRRSVFQEAGSDSDDPGLLKLSSASGTNQFNEKKKGKSSNSLEAGASLGKNNHKKRRK
ncbi:hypothetical protein R1flu_020950 [Riccia fluitans]|uniref:CCAAT-binding factor domain-containing protein n=1 Tax=Riccia fluitans TaxID=41844 RepID=A0ABD1ZP56_9MARC